MAQQNIDTGTRGDANTGDDLNAAMAKIEANFTELYNDKADRSEVVFDTGGQSIDGNKAFNGQTQFRDATFHANANQTPPANPGLAGFFLDLLGKWQFQKLGSGITAGLDLAALTANREYDLPDVSGELAVLSTTTINTIQVQDSLSGYTYTNNSNGILIQFGNYGYLNVTIGNINSSGAGPGGTLQLTNFPFTLNGTNFYQFNVTQFSGSNLTSAQAALISGLGIGSSVIEFKSKETITAPTDITFSTGLIRFNGIVEIG